MPYFTFWSRCGWQNRWGNIGRNRVWGWSQRNGIAHLGLDDAGWQRLAALVHGGIHHEMGRLSCNAAARGFSMSNRLGNIWLTLHNRHEFLGNPGDCLCFWTEDAADFWVRFCVYGYVECRAVKLYSRKYLQMRWMHRVQVQVLNLKVSLYSPMHSKATCPF